MEHILERIKVNRLRKNYSQEQMGRKLNIVASAYGKIERGQTELTLNRLIQISDILGLKSNDLTLEFLKSSKTPQKATVESIKLSIEEELQFVKEISYMFKSLVNHAVDEKYRLIMLDFPVTEFSIRDWFISLDDKEKEKEIRSWWNSLIEDQRKQVNQTEEAYIDFLCGYPYLEIYNPEDEYEGFKKLIISSDIYYFFKFGFIEDKKLNDLFQKYCLIEDTHGLPMNSKISSETVSNYLKTIENINVFKNAPIIFVQPGPQNDSFILKTYRVSDGEYIIYDMDGTQIAHGTITSEEHLINLSLSPGFYQIEVKDKNEGINKKRFEIVKDGLNNVVKMMSSISQNQDFF